jgi:hypothetical protein
VTDKDLGYLCFFCGGAIEAGAIYSFLVDVSLFRQKDTLGNQWFFSHVGCFRRASAFPEWVDDMMDRLTADKASEGEGTA